MNFSPHIRQLFQLRGRASTYLSPDPGAEPVALKAIRQGGGQRIQMGYIKVTPERTCFHVQRTDVPAPKAGAALAWDGETFTIDAVQPVERDADGLMWELDASWGLDITIRSMIGTGAGQAPPQGGGFKIGAPASAGAAAIWIKSVFTVGTLIAGDKITIAGDATQYTVTGPDVAAESNQFAGVTVTPVLAAAARSDVAVAIDFIRDYTVRAGIASYGTAEYAGTVQMGDRRIVVLRSALDLVGMTDALKPGDRISLENQSFSVVMAETIYQAGAAYAWGLQLRKG